MVWEGDKIIAHIPDELLDKLAQAYRLRMRLDLFTIDVTFIGNFRILQNNVLVDNAEWEHGVSTIQISEYSTYLCFQSKHNPQSTVEFKSDELAKYLGELPRYTVISNSSSDEEEQFNESYSFEEMKLLSGTDIQEFDTYAECEAYGLGVAAAAGYMGDGIVKTFADIRELDQIGVIQEQILIGNFIGLLSNEMTNSGKPWYNATDIEKAGLPFSPGAMGNGTDTLKFKSSWDWLMVVVEKINSIQTDEENFEFTAVIHPSHFVVYKNPNDTEIIRVEHANDNIDMVYRGVVDFIKWYNNQ